MNGAKSLETKKMQQKWQQNQLHEASKWLEKHKFNVHLSHPFEQGVLNVFWMFTCSRNMLFLLGEFMI